MQERSISDIVSATAQAVARRTIEEAEIIHLSTEEQRRFVDLLLNPPELAPAMERAKQAHRRLIRRSR